MKDVKRGQEARLAVAFPTVVDVDARDMVATKALKVELSTVKPMEVAVDVSFSDAPKALKAVLTSV